MKCTSRQVYHDLVVVLAPFAPHICEELWHAMGEEGTVCDARWPQYDEKYLVENTIKYAVSFNGKTRFSIEVAADTLKEDVEKAALSAPGAEKWIAGKTPRKIIVVPGKIVNIVI